MSHDQSIFAPRRSSNERIRPTQESLDIFLAHTEKVCGRELHLSDVSEFRRMLKVSAGTAEKTAKSALDLGALMHMGVLGKSGYLSAELPRAVEEFKYHLEALHALDFRSPMTLLKSLELEMSRLNVNKARDLILMVKFQEMIAGQKKIRSGLMRRYLQIATELFDIALYVRGNLIRIEERCEAAMSMLATFEIGREKEQQLLDEIKNKLKAQLKAGLSRGLVSKVRLASARSEYTALTQEIAQCVRADTATLRGLYQKLGNRMKKATQEIDNLLREIENKKSGTVKENRGLFRLVGDELVLLLSIRGFEAGSVYISQETTHHSLLEAVRKRMVGHLLDAVTRGRRGRADRRSRPDRRTSAAARYKGPERRSGTSRRSSAGRRRQENHNHASTTAQKPLVHIL
ncbi:MAG TPA: hypothetical protein VK654_07550 [Nitrospirota bacterium]|nr:hypothetical protein [Nitrospirota bacterium]